ncbi:MULTISPECIES: TetR/AcrR family transcriptional regulator [unclassified Photobacterium]|uniref:TetR/AcrR family transcriptional regulator n=1 Tax=unclassified Photobacterium TaxID=2628852 RepID=UPI000D1778E5|nr:MULTISPECIES: TetR/AcrR family transcriptional regulator [unclassified Photobacterium]PSV26598.1 TetR/AcrR family transcriptional regulator [Photobacterium sp. GB-56]PSV31742.1 TetR/AcrR family transcriptional regulator [Photobacterium sp. GB-72]PSV37496.1 TetR/AcrR family transcriptional regulator [Photobacterium sp. GB-27]PSV39094.1 TetR/AcrR family transcriptional regulator [Photobacterium sp. GB-210]PSV45435.1 TetR/AcrR family transcriptional regulator [Photobacterium sp. GB-36]
MDTITKKTRTRLSPEKRRQQLLDYSLEVFARRGIGRAGHADIAEMANVSVATVFNYFPTRESLVEQVLIEVENEFSALLEECLGDKNKTLHARLTCISHNLIDTVLEQQDWIKVWFEWSTSVRDEVWPQFVETNRNNLHKVRDAFAQAIDNGEITTAQKADDLAKLLHGICYVIYIQANLLPDQTALQEQAEIYLEALALNR